MHPPSPSTKLRRLALPALLLTSSAPAKPEMRLTHAAAMSFSFKRQGSSE